MNIAETVATLKPYAIGGALGAAALAIVSFNANWIVTTGTMNDKVQAAQISAYAEVCQNNALLAWTEQGKELSALGGFRNDERKTFAQQFTPLAQDAALRNTVVNACDRLLRAT